MDRLRVIALILVVTFLVFPAGCEQDTSDPVLEAAIDMAYADFSLMNLAISGSEYVEMTEKYLINPETYYQEMVIEVNGIKYSMNEFRQLSEEESVGSRRSSADIVKEYEFSDHEFMTNTFVSKVVDDMDFSLKHVFARTKNVLIGKEIYIFRKYTFKEDGDEWRILTVKEYWDFIEEPFDPRTMQQYLVYDGKSIEYSREIELAK